MSADVTDLEAARIAREAKRAEEGMPEIADEIREARRQYDQPEDAPITLAEVARVALDRYRVARGAAWDLWREQRKAAGKPRHAVYTAPDDSRPWDVCDRDGQTVVERQREDLDEAMLHLLANDPHSAVSTLQCAAYLLKKAIKRQQEKKARAERAERIARKHERERAKIEQEERRLVRERERARKRIGLGVRGVAS